MRTVAMLGVLAVIAAVPGQLPAANSAAPPPDVLAQGRVTVDTSTDTGPVQDATVTVWWIPGLDTAQVGDRLPIETLASTPVNADGTYTIALTPTAAMRKVAAANGGWVNFDISASSPGVGKTTMSGISRRIVNGAWVVPGNKAPAATRATGARSAPLGAVGDEDPSTPASTTTVTDLVLTDSSGDIGATGAAAKRTASAAEPAPSASVPCSFVTTGNPQRSVNVVEFHNAANANASWTYGQTADSDVEGGIQYNGSGDWSIGATKHVSNNNSSSVGRSYTDKINNFGTTDFKFVDGYYQPYGSGTTCNGTSIPVNTKVKNPVSWVSGVGGNQGPGSEYIGCDQSPQNGHRVTLALNGFYERKSNTASRIGGAVDLGPITVGATSGFSTNMSSKWTAKRGKVWLCGTNKDVPYAGVIHAQNA